MAQGAPTYLMILDFLIFAFTFSPMVIAWIEQAETGSALCS